MDPISPLPLDHSLRDLHEQYIDAVNQAVAEDRDDLVRALASAYPDDALVLLASRDAA